MTLVIKINNNRDDEWVTVHEDYSVIGAPMSIEKLVKKLLTPHNSRTHFEVWCNQDTRERIMELINNPS